MFIMGCVMGFTMGYWTDKHDFAGCRWWTTQRWTMLAEWRAWISSNFHWLKVQEGCSWMYLTPMIVVYCYLKIQLYLSVHLSRYMILHDIWWRRRTSSHSIRVLPFSAWPPISRRFSKNRVACKEIFQLRTEDVITHLPATLTKNQAG